MSSENVDSFAQDYLERARKRREMLAQKLADTSPRRKRSGILQESQNITRSPTKACDDDSPNKRQCVRQVIKPDTPAIPSVRSRLKHIVSDRQNWEDVSDESPPEPVPATVADLHTEMDRDLSPAPGARRNRLAALAQSINTWEEDLSHPVIKKEEKPKKTWEPPKPIETQRKSHASGPVAPSSERVSRDLTRRAYQSGPTKPTRTFEYLDEKRERSPSPVKSSYPTKTYSPVKSSSPAKTQSPIREVKQEGSRIVSSITVNLAGASSSTDKPEAVKQPWKSSPVKQYAKVQSPSNAVKSRAEASPVRSFTARETSPVKANSPVRALAARDSSPVKAPLANRLATLQKEGGKRRESFEPSAQPVSSRLAGWQERVNKVENEKMEMHTNAQSRIPIVPKVLSPTKSVNEIEPTATPVHSRMANWEQKSQEEEKLSAKAAFFSAQTPGKSNRAISPVKVEKPATVSPTKLAPGAKAIQEKLQQLQDGWQKNEISEQIKQQRQADLAVLENRWKNGILNEEQYTHSEPAPVESTVVLPRSSNGGAPPPPPLPTTYSKPLPQKGLPSPRKSPVKLATKSPRTPRHVDDETKSKIRAVHQQMVEMVMGDQTGECKSANNDPNFESKLKTLGFEIDKSEKSRVATLDLKEQREIDRQKRAAEIKSPKKPAIHVTEERVTSTNFRDTKVSETKTKLPGTPLTVHHSVSMTPVGSLYSLIRKQTPAHGATGNATAAPSQRRPDTVNFHDSFSSDETSFEEDAPPVPPKITITTDIRREATSSDYSESQPEETQSETEESDDENSLEDIETTQSDSSSNADNSEIGGDISDLLDEAMDDTVTDPPIPAPRNPAVRSPSPVYVARKLPPEAHPGHPDHIPASPLPVSQQLPPQQPPPKHPRLHQQQQQSGEEKKRVAFTSPGGSTYRSDSSSSEKSLKREIVHSVDNYRNSANIKRNAPEPRLKIIRRSEHFDTDDDPSPEALPYIPPDSSRQRLQSERSAALVKSFLQELKDLVDQEQIIIKQTSNALNQCYLSDPMYAGADRIVDCHRILLQACKKREAYITEMERLRSGRLPVAGGPKGSLTISDIRLPLKREFINKLHSPDMNAVHYFIILFRKEAHVIFTQMVCTDDPVVSDSLDIPNMLPNIEIKQDFKISMEVYSMSINREPPEPKTPKKKKLMTPKKSTLKKHAAFQSPGGPSAVRTSDFQCIATLPITLNIVNKTHFNLEKVPYSSPLHGTIHMRLRCMLEVVIEEKGFLTMFEDVSGMGAWHRRWCVLKHNVLSFWKYPDDAKFKDPIGQIDLKSCITDEVGLVSRDQCARPNTFELLTVRPQTNGESDTLISRCYNTMTTTKLWLSADTKEDRYVWCHKFNEALRSLRAWNPEAFRPIKRQVKTGTNV